MDFRTGNGVKPSLLGILKFLKSLEEFMYILIGRAVPFRKFIYYNWCVVCHIVYSVGDPIKPNTTISKWRKNATLTRRGY